MIEITTGDILSAGTDALVNTVQLCRYHGPCIALQFKNAYPTNFRAYEAACKRHEVQPGRMFIHETGKFSPRFIINSRPNDIGGARAALKTSRAASATS